MNKSNLMEWRECDSFTFDRVHLRRGIGLTRG